jgi:hypothetical protein
VFRLVRLLERPRLMQSRIFHIPAPEGKNAERTRFGQLTFRVLSEQTPVRNENAFPVESVGFDQRRVWVPAARPKDGRIYYFDPKGQDRTYRPGIERFSQMPLLDKARGSFGNSGRVIEIDKKEKLYKVENFVIMERRLVDPQTAWRIHHF